MPRIATLIPTARAVRYAIVGALAFTLGAATLAAAGPTISGFVGLIDGNNTAAINANRELSVTDAQLGTTPVQLSRFATFAAGQRFSDTLTLYTVPAGKIFVLDSVAAGSNMDPTDRLMDVQLSLTSGDFIAYVVAIHAQDEGVFTQTNARIFRGGEPMTAYAAAGTNITAFGTRDGGALTSTALRIAISGHLVNAP